MKVTLKGLDSPYIVAGDWKDCERGFEGMEKAGFNLRKAQLGCCCWVHEAHFSVVTFLHS